LAKSELALSFFLIGVTDRGDVPLYKMFDGRASGSAVRRTVPRGAEHGADWCTWAKPKEIYAFIPSANDG
jgi:hypothetical protein